MAGNDTVSWCTIESDPGVFSELIEQMGVKDVQVEEIYSLDEASFADFSPVYGLIFLFKWRSEKDDRPVESEYDFYFARQVITNACATQAILSVLLNRPSIDLGAGLTEFKNFTKTFNPDDRGVALSACDIVKTAHNSFARPEPFVVESKAAKDDDDVFHFIAYVPINGKLYELDGLKQGPILLGPCTDENWLAVAQPAIQKRIERYARSEIRFNLMAIVRKRSAVYSAAIQNCNSKLEALKSESAQPNISQSDKDNLSAQIAELNNQISNLQAKLEAEAEKQRAWKIENIRRKHNYIPFIVNMLRLLAEKGELPQLVKKAMEKPPPARQKTG